MEVVDDPIRVQTLVGKEAVPPQYVQPLETRPQRIVGNGNDNDNDEPSPPVIDLSKGSSVREQLERACRDWGAFHVINHGVPVELLGEMRRLGRSFFEDCTMDQKLSYGCDPNSPASEGYGSRMLVASNDTVLDWRDYYDHHTLPLSRQNPSKWPHFSPNYRKVVADYSDQMNSLAEKLLCLISESLGLPSSCIRDAIGEFYQNITVSYYPPCPQPELTLGLQSHSDMGAITLLIQDDVGGLEVLKDGKWVLVNPLCDAIFVILADQTEMITNGQYKSAPHRAITNGKKARLSVATFHDPAKMKIISPAFEPPKYRPVRYGDYVSSWYTQGPEGKRNVDALLI
ncbi:2-oxoglutarate and oxygenase superfamily protein [Perilla frutescens var. hirtella]|uniref:2-oxoglutarate and oxygenase superfamily protein n=1 Tax=Perilla frutescens var. hirtella TaxID=608512 RepID=A0AAD4JPU6_PERFH|nr:2-oxoglutarate and oxygenase superfamily protein [Perilla frutescens var. hirtella]